MPFTLAHPAAVLPFLKISKRYVNITALVIGSMVPDAAYFIPVEVSREHSHSPFGLLWFCFPFGILAYFLFVWLFKKPLMYLLPMQLSQRILIKHDGSEIKFAANFIVLTASLIVGSMTHLLWDSFTHPGAFFVERIPILQQALFQIGGYTVWVFKVLQHGSTLFGFVVILLVLKRWYFTTQIQLTSLPANGMQHCQIITIVFLIVVPTAFGIIMALITPRTGQSVQQLQQLVGCIVIFGGKMLIACIAIYAILWHLLARMGRIQTEN